MFTIWAGVPESMIEDAATVHLAVNGTAYHRVFTFAFGRIQRIPLHVP